MTRALTVAAAQLGPIARDDSRRSVVDRLIALLRLAHEAGVELVVFPELALTTFFPRWFMEDQAEVDSFFETAMPVPETRRLFETAASLGIAFYLGHLASNVFQNALLFSFALSGVGLAIIALGLLYHRQRSALARWFDARLPAPLRALRPQRGPGAAS